MQVLLVHGLGRTPLSMLALARRLHREGHQTALFGYFAATESVERIRARLRCRLQTVAERSKPYAAIGHSLGGVLLASMFTEWPRAVPPPARFVTLGMPTKPPRLLRRVMAHPLYRMATGDAGQYLTDPISFEPLVTLQVHWTAVVGTGGWRGRWSPFAGELNDGALALSETQAPAAALTIMSPTLHTFLMNKPEVQSAICRSLANSDIRIVERRRPGHYDHLNASSPRP